MYRIDPVIQYQFVAGLMGVRHRAPMFGPLVFDDVRRSRSSLEPKHRNPYGFVERERIGSNSDNQVLVRRFPERPMERGWVAWLSCREELHENPRKRDELWRRYRDQFAEEIVPSLGQLLSPRVETGSLFPSLWNDERAARENLRQSLLQYEPLGSVDDLISQIKLGLRSVPRQTTSGIHHLGIYLSTGERWLRRGSSDAALPDVVQEPAVLDTDHINDHGLFTTVSRSTRPALLSRDYSEEWRSRLLVGDDSKRLAKLVDSDLFSGGMLVPILYPYDHSQSIGLVLLVGLGTPRIRPADVFLMTRLAEDIGGHLAPHLPVPGFPFWPEVSQSSSGLMSIDTRSRSRPGLIDLTDEDELTVPHPDLRRLARRLLPDADATISDSLVQGKSGAYVVRVESARSDRIEIPRVMKVARAGEVVSESLRYQTYVQDTVVGQASRIEQKLVADGLGAILYTFVGAGTSADAITWSNWAVEAELSELGEALDMVFEKLRCWYDASRRVPQTARDALIEDILLIEHSRWRVKAETKSLSDPTVGEVVDVLVDLVERGRCPQAMTESVIHGDLHCGNVFSLVAPSNSQVVMTDVALIDWGRTQHGFAMIDVTMLAADLLFSVRWATDDWADLVTVVDEWVTRCAIHNRCQDDWRYAYIYILARMLFFTDTETATHFPPEARLAAFEELRINAEYLCQESETVPEPRLGAGAGLRQSSST